MQPSLRLVRPSDQLPKDELDALFRSYSRYVASIALRLLGRDDEIDDIVQEVFVVAMHGLRKLREPNAIRGWLATVAVRIARRKLRRRRLRAFVGLDEAPDYARVIDAPQERVIVIVRAY